MKRLMRLRQSQIIRDMLAETDFNMAQLIQPLFTVENLKTDEAVPGLKGVSRQSIDNTLKTIEKDLELGVRQFILFCVPSEKRESDFNFDSAANAISEIKKRFGSHLQLWVDTCLCSSTTHGHCCVFKKDGTRNHDETLNTLSRAAVAFASSGADGISPSDMMDGRTSTIREALNENGLENIPIMSYSTKFSSHFYGPFRNAASSSPQFGDRSAYQIDVRNRSDAMGSSIRCAAEGADLLMVKPGMTSLDLIAPIFEATGVPVGAYQVSGEYAALALLEREGLISFERALLETWQCFKRAKSQYIITYGARFGLQLGVKGSP
jgi:porphobilinogen synthase